MLGEERQSLIEEACGVFAYLARTPTHDVCARVLEGLRALQHRGQESAGMVWTRGASLGVCKAPGQVSQLAQVMPEVVGGEVELAIGHVRYGTSGERVMEEAQPLVMESQFGPLVLAHNGHITNADILREKLIARGATFLTSTDSEVILQAIAWDDAETLEQALCRVCTTLRGAFSIVVHAPKHGLFACRDPHGVRPLLLATGDEAYVVTSETSALEHLEVREVREVWPGEVVCLWHGEMPRSLWPHEPVPRAACVFELVYFASARSEVFGHEVHAVRHAFGAQLARQSPAPGADCVIHVPHSSLYAAQGYAEVTGLPIVDALKRHAEVGRTFLAPTQSEREALVRAKFSVDEQLVRGKHVVLVDDSLVRGTTARGVVAMLREAGVKEVHLRIASAPIIERCHYGIDTPDLKELVAASRVREDLVRELGVESLEYLDVAGMYRALANREGFCDACFTGRSIIA